MKLNNIYDITIIGGGPVGLFAAFYAGLRNAKVKIIESLSELGGQPNHLYPNKNIYDIPAYPRISGNDLTKALLSQLSRFEIEYCLGETAEKIIAFKDNEDSYYEIQSREQIHYSRTIIIAGGNGSFKPRKLSFNHWQNYEQNQIAYHVSELDKYRGKKVVICGGGDSAVDWALSLNKIADQVSLVHRRNEFRAMESSVEHLLASNVNIYTPYLPVGINNKNGLMTHLIVEKARSQERISIELDQLIVSYGFSSSLGPLKDWGFNIKRNAIEVNYQMETNRPGIYAIGDIASYEGKVKIIATGFGEAPLAVNNALSFIDPRNTIAPVHTTELFEGE